jgi:hypothetical protein
MISTELTFAVETRAFLLTLLFIEKSTQKSFTF